MNPIDPRKLAGMTAAEFSKLMKPGKLVRLLMRTGKHAGQIVTAAAHPSVCYCVGGDRWRCTLPGLEGDGILLPDQPEAN